MLPIKSSIFLFSEIKNEELKIHYDFKTIQQFNLQYLGFNIIKSPTSPSAQSLVV